MRSRPTRRSGWTWLMVACLLALSIPGSAQIQFDAEVDRREVTYGEPVTLSLTLSQRSRGGRIYGLSAPQVPQIPGFAVASQRAEQGMQMVNQDVLTTVRTVVTLLPEKVGTLVIPAMTIQLPGGAQATTQPIPVKVLPRSGGGANDDDPDAGGAVDPADPDGMTADDPGSAQGSRVGWFQAGVVIVAVLGLLLSLPLLLSFVLNRGRRPSMRRSGAAGSMAEVEDVEPVPVSPIDGAGSRVGSRRNGGSTSTQGAVADQGVAGGGRSPVEMAARAGAGGQTSGTVVPLQPAPIDFDREVERLTRESPEVDREFLRRFFDVFHRALLASDFRPPGTMTPAELMAAVGREVSDSTGLVVSRLQSDWESVVYAGMMPARPWRDLLGDARAVIAGLRGVQPHGEHNRKVGGPVGRSVHDQSRSGGSSGSLIANSPRRSESPAAASDDPNS